MYIRHRPVDPALSFKNKRSRLICIQGAKSLKVQIRSKQFKKNPKQLQKYLKIPERPSTTILATWNIWRFFRDLSHFLFDFY